MRRNSSDLRILAICSWILFLVFYQSLTSLTQILPPLLGLFFTYLIILSIEKSKTMKKYDQRWYFAIAYIIFAEQVHGFWLFSTIIAFLLFYNFIADWLLVTFKSKAILLVIFVASSYLCTFGVSRVFSYALNLPALNFGYEYLIYIALESLLAIVIFKGRLV